MPPDPDQRVSAARERVRNTRRLIAESKQLLQSARQALDSSKLLRVAVRRALLKREP